MEKLMKIKSFNYYNTGKMRFIGVELPITGDPFDTVVPVQTLYERLEPLKVQLQELQKEYGADIQDLCFGHHSNNTELGNNDRHMLGYFFQEDTPVPPGADFFDIHTDQIGYGLYITETYIEDEGNAYGETRDRILHDGNCVPYPVGYWAAAVFTNGLPHEGKYRFGYVLPVLGNQL